MNKPNAFIIPVLLLLFTIFIPFHAYSQENESYVEGRVKESESQTDLANVVCRIFGKDGKQLSYTVTNSKGVFKIKNRKDADYVTFSFLGYKREKVNFDKLILNPTVIMEPGVIELKEVSVGVSPIKRRGDTITYNVALFTEKQDRSVGDVLKKLPGIKVTDKGVVTYQGKPINKFYIEGQDLLGTRYNQATNSLPIDAVAKIEVLENNQHIKALKKVVFSDRAAINIRLKSAFKIRPFGEVVAGGGSPRLWNNRIFLMNVNAKNQILITGKMNNSGEDISSETRENIDFADIYSYEPLPSDILYSSYNSNALVPREKHLRNKSAVGGVNNLFKLTEDSNLKLNVLLYNDRTLHSDSTLYIYGGNIPLSLTEVQNKTNRANAFVPILQYENNSAKLYIQEEFKGSFSNSYQNSILSSDRKAVIENVESKPNYFQNKLSVTINNDNRRVYRFNSMTRYYERNEILDFDRTLSQLGGKGEKLFERIGSKQMFSKNRLGTIYPIFGKKIHLNLDYKFKNDRFDTSWDFNNYGASNSLVNSVSDRFVNKQQHHIGLSAGYSYRYSHMGIIGLTLPFYVDLFGFSSSTLERTKRDLFSGVSPELSLSHNFNPNLKLRASSSYNNASYSDTYLSTEPIYKNYRTLQYSSDKIDRGSVWRMSTSLNYQDLAEMIFINLSGNFNIKNQNLFADYSYTDRITEIKPVLGKNKSQSMYFSASIDKTFTSIGLSIKAGSNYSQNRYMISQSGQQFENTSNAFSGNFTTRFKKLKWMSAVYKLSGNIAWQENKVGEGYPLRSLFHEGQIFVFPLPKTSLSVSLVHNSLEIKKGHFHHTTFLDAEAGVSPWKRIELKVKASNLFDVKTYSVASMSGLNYRAYFLPLRGREVLVSCLFRI